MRIDSVDTFPCTFGTDRERMSFLFVRVTADDGSVGWGEVCDSYGCSYAGVLAHLIDEVFAPLVVGQELTSVDLLADRMRLFTRRRLGDAWVAPQARSGVEIALWDLAGQAAGRSVSSLLGRTSDRIEVYASCGFLEEGPAEHHYEVLGPLLERGVRKVKVRTGPDWLADIDTLRKLQPMLGAGVELMVDASETYTLPTARASRRRSPSSTCAGSRSRCRRAPGRDRVARRPLAGAGRLWRAPVRARRRARRDAAAPTRRAPTGCGDRRRHRRGPQDGDGCAGVRRARRTARLLRPGRPRRQPARRRERAGDPARRIPAEPAPRVGHVRNGTRASVSTPSTTAICASRTPPGLGVGIDPDAVARFPYQAPGARVAGTTTGLPDRFVGDR